MNIRVIGGVYGGRKLDAPAGGRTHPMSERARNALFNSLGSTLKEAEVLDAFAGTGALGFEALSRGARRVTFVERDKVAQNAIVKNITTLNCSAKTHLVRTSVSNWLATTTGMEFDLIFADPPYHDPQFSTVIRLFPLLKPGGIMVLSHPGRGEVPTDSRIVVVDNRSYGNANLTVYRREI